MSNVIKIFENDEFGSLRTLTDEHGRIMFCGKDVASALGYSNTKDAIRRHCRWGVKHDLPHPQSPTKKIKMIFIPESDVYRLVAHSKLPRAEKFESWIFDEILPQINHTGGYVSNEDMFIENYLPFLEEPYQKLFRLQMTAIRKLNERIRHDQPLVDFAGAGATVPLTGFGYNLCKGVEKAVSEKGFLGIFTGGLTAASGGIAAALVFGFLVSIIFRSKSKK